MFDCIYKVENESKNRYSHLETVIDKYNTNAEPLRVDVPHLSEFTYNRYVA